MWTIFEVPAQSAEWIYENDKKEKVSTTRIDTETIV